MRIRKLARNNSGQALVETAFILPLLLTLILNAVNFAFFFLMALNITASSRSGGIYAIMGGATPAGIGLPKAGPPTVTGCQATGTTVSDLALLDMYGAVYCPTLANTGVNVCSSRIGVSGSGSTAKTTCTNYGIGSSTTPDSDPEAPAFLLGRVDVAYQFNPPIPQTPFNALLLVAPNCSSSGGTVTCTFYRHIEMREMQ
jgi:hypothetical protein